MEIKNNILLHKEHLIALVRKMHRNPELSLQEFETTKIIRNELSSAGIEILEYGLATGVIAIIRGEKPGPTIAMRADIDALPITEDPANPVVSLHEGVMHACGHDVHTVSLLGAAFALQSMRKELCGQLLLIFQPAEEISMGAHAVIETGIFHDFPPEAFFSLHMMPDVKAGQVSVRSGPIMAAQECFNIEIAGKGSHGAAPHLAKDPIAAATDIAGMLQRIDSRMIDPLKPFVLSVCSIHGGTAFNIVPDHCSLKGTFRFLHDELRDFIMDSVRSVVQNIAAIYGCCAEVEFYLELPANVNAPRLTTLALASARMVFSEDNIVQSDTKMSSEDYSVYSTLAPTFMYHVGCGRGACDIPLHNSRFFVDDDVLLNTAALMAYTAVSALNA